MTDRALVLACAGCCCGHPGRSRAAPSPGALRREMRRAFRAAGLEGRARLAFTECLGPCSESNVVLAYVDGRPVWLRRMDTAEAFAALLEHLAAVTAGLPAALPAILARRSFAWTGGGDGPAPPVEAE
jgi:(2Fe-2S) ferredoxin